MRSKPMSFIALGLGTVSVLFSQAPKSCRVISPPVDSRNIFSLSQEADLGDAIAESQLQDLNVVAENDAHLQRVAARLVRNSPLSAMPLRTYVVEIPQANAFVLPGGRVYVSRGLIALLQSEDELAGVLAHELGHLLAHQQAVAVSLLMKASLDITQVNNRRDIFDKYSQLLENQWRKPDLAAHLRQSQENDQIQADSLGLQLQVAAGYDPSAQIRAFDRLAETHGKTGSFLSNLFNFEPNEKRLHELFARLPPGCPVTEPMSGEDFVAWRQGVAKNVILRSPETLPGILSRVSLTPPLRGDLKDLRFSPDGHHLLAQDDGGVTVLTVQPFRIVFRIPLESVSTARFTPDSRQVILQSSNTHIERWNIAEQIRADAVDVPLRNPCPRGMLAPDGRTLACLDPVGTLRLYNVASGETIVEKQKFTSGMTSMSFSPDAHYFLASAPLPSGSTLAWDLTEQRQLPLHGELRKLGRQYFTFVAPERLMLSPWTPAAKSGSNVTATLVAFPSGETVASPTLPSGPISRATDPGSVIIRPLGKFAVGAITYAAGTAITNKAPALDVLGRFYAAERSTGELALYEKGKGVQATAQLPMAELSRLQAAAASPDGQYLAASASTRAGVWNLGTGTNLLSLPAFHGGFFEAAQHFLALIPEAGDQEPHTIEVSTASLDVQKGADIRSRLARQVGPYLTDIRTDDGSPPHFDLETASYQDVILDVKEARTLQPLWSRTFGGEAPRLFFGSARHQAVFLWGPQSRRVTSDPVYRNSWVGQSTADQRNCREADISRRIFKQQLVSGFYVAEIVDMATGKAENSVTFDLVDRCLGIRDAMGMGKAVVIEDTLNRVLLYRDGRQCPQFCVNASRLSCIRVGRRKSPLSSSRRSRPSRIHTSRNGAQRARARRFCAA